MTKAEEKKQLRAQIRAEEAALSQRYLESADAAIAARVLAMPEYLQAGTVFCFVSTPREIDTRPILADALARGKRLCVPLCAEKGVMELRRITALDQLAPGAYGIPEPPADSPAVSCDETDFAVIPCLSCDRSGRRLGRGGGYYDRFFVRLSRRRRAGVPGASGAGGAAGGASRPAGALGGHGAMPL